MLQPELFENLPLLADGGYPDGPSPAEGAEGWCLAEDPKAMRDYHAGYREAGARLLRTHVPRANEIMLAGTPLAGRAEAICHTAATLAREALGVGGAGQPGAVAGNLRPPPEEALRTLHPREVEAALAAQIIYLSDKEVDLFIVEHLQPGDAGPDMIGWCARESDAAILAVMRPWPGMDATALRAHGELLANAGAQALGLGCFPQGDNELFAWMEALHPLGLPLAWFPSGAKEPPGAAGGMEDAAFATHLRKAGNAGALIVGGCCGVPATALHMP